MLVVLCQLPMAAAVDNRKAGDLKQDKFILLQSRRPEIPPVLMGKAGAGGPCSWGAPGRIPS